MLAGVAWWVCRGDHWWSWWELWGLPSSGCIPAGLFWIWSQDGKKKQTLTDEEVWDSWRQKDDERCGMGQSEGQRPKPSAPEMSQTSKGSLTPNPKELEDKLNELKESLKGKDQHWHVVMGWKNEMFLLPTSSYQVDM